MGCGVAVGLGVAVGIGVPVGASVGTGVADGIGVGVGTGVYVGFGVSVGSGVFSSMVVGWSPAAGCSVVGRVENMPGGAVGEPSCSPLSPPQAITASTAKAAILAVDFKSAPNPSRRIIIFITCSVTPCSLSEEGALHVDSGAQVRLVDSRHGWLQVALPGGELAGGLPSHAIKAVGRDGGG